MHVGAVPSQLPLARQVRVASPLSTSPDEVHECVATLPVCCVSVYAIVMPLAAGSSAHGCTHSPGVKIEHRQTGGQSHWDWQRTQIAAVPLQTPSAPQVRLASPSIGAPPESQEVVATLPTAWPSLNAIVAASTAGSAAQPQ